MPTEPRLRCAITGATGFIGRALAARLGARGLAVSAWPRTPVFDLAGSGGEAVPAAWVEYLRGVDVVVHLAGLAHQPRDAAVSEQYFRLNRDGTLRLAAAAQAAGVKRFIFLSSAKVFGEGGATIYRAATAPAPADAYAQSKWQAEQLLAERFGSRMELVILRPPLVYARDAKANFARLMQLARLPLPLPLAGIDNRRALIGLDNLVDLIALCLTHPAAAGKTLLCADAAPYSLPEIVAAIRRALDREPDLFRLPAPLLGALKRLLGAGAAARLFGDFQLDGGETSALLDWKPPFTMEQILRGDTAGTAA